MVFSLITSVSHQRHYVIIGHLLLSAATHAQARLAPYEQCHQTFQAIINGSTSVGPINNVTIWNSGIIYTGTFEHLSSSFQRDSIITPTIYGKKLLYTDPYIAGHILTSLSDQGAKLSAAQAYNSTCQQRHSR